MRFFSSEWRKNQTKPISDYLLMIMNRVFKWSISGVWMKLLWSIGAGSMFFVLFWKKVLDLNRKNTEKTQNIIFVFFSKNILDLKKKKKKRLTPGPQYNYEIMKSNLLRFLIRFPSIEIRKLVLKYWLLTSHRKISHHLVKVGKCGEVLKITV